MRWVNSFLLDLRYTVRGWRNAPGFFLTAITTLALGIGANTAIFSVVSAVLLRPLPFAEPERLVQMYETNPGNRVEQTPYGLVIFRDLEEWRTHSELVQSMASYTTSGVNLQGSGDPERILTLRCEPGLFSLLGVPPLIGRTFEAGDPEHVVVASNSFWRAHLNGDLTAVGRSLLLDDRSYTLIGVMPDGFQFPHSVNPVGLWLPWNLRAEMQARPNGRLDAVIGRLRPGASIEAAEQELSAMEGTSLAGRTVRLKRLEDVVSGSVRNSLLVLFGAVGMVLLVACVNVANLILAHSASREREIAIRAALGAGRSRLLQQLLTESLVLAAAGGFAGLAVGMAASRLLVTLAGSQIPRAAEVGFDWRAFVFLLVVSTASGVGFGLVPALTAARGSEQTIRSRSATFAPRDGLVVVEIAMCFVLLVGAGLLTRTFLNLQRTGSGVQADHVLTLHIVVVGPGESMAIEERVAQLPGVRAAGLISLLPLQHSNWTGGFSIEGRQGVHPAELRYVTPGYFGAMGIPLLRGRAFSSRDVPDQPRVIVVNETLARQHFPNEEAVGQITDRGRIVGVVGDVRQETLGTPPKAEIYYAVAQNFAQLRRVGSTLVVRAGGPPETLAGPIRAAVREVSPGQALFQMATMQRVIEESLTRERLYAWLLGVFAALATLLVSAGIYGVISYLVALRTREFGIRVALGARSGQVLQLVMQRAAALIAVGLALGIGGALGMTRVLRGVLYGVESSDPGTFAITALALGLAAAVACLEPALRAARVDPASALRSE